VHKDSISIAVRNAAGKIVMECVIETKTSTILQFIDGLRGDVQVTLKKQPGPPGCTTSRRAHPPDNRAPGAEDRNRSRLISWAAKQEKLQPQGPFFSIDFYLYRTNRDLLNHYQG
jgi:hypothetical protein